MTLDYDAMKFWIDALQLAGIAVIGAHSWISNRHRVTSERIAKLEDDMDTRLDTHTDRLTALEVRAGAAPTHDDLKRLHQRLDNMNGELKELRGEFQSAGRTLNMIHDYLLNHGSGK